MGDPPGQLPDRLHLLRLAQRLLGGGAARRLTVEILGAHEGQPGERDEEGGRRQAEDQVTGQKIEPLPPYRVDMDAGADVERKTVELADRISAVRSVDLRRRRIESAVRIARDALHEAATGIELDVERDRAGIAGENDAVGPDHREIAALDACQALVEIVEVARPNRNHDDSGECAAGIEAPSAHREEPHVRDPGGENPPDIGADVVFEVGAEISPVRHVQVRRRRMAERRHQGTTLAIDDPDLVHRRQRPRHLPELKMQLLRAADLFVRRVASDRLDAGEGDAEGLKDLRHLLADDVERAFDAFVGECEARPVGADCEIGEQRRRHQDCRHQHPSQQTNGAWVARFHLSPDLPVDRSDPGARLACGIDFGGRFHRAPAQVQPRHDRRSSPPDPAEPFEGISRTHQMVGHKCRGFKARARCSAAGKRLCAAAGAAENFWTRRRPPIGRICRCNEDRCNEDRLPLRLAPRPGMVSIGTVSTGMISGSLSLSRRRTGRSVVTRPQGGRTCCRPLPRSCATFSSSSP